MSVTRLTRRTDDQSADLHREGSGSEGPIGLDLAELLRIVRRRMSFIFATVIVIMAFGVVVLFSLTPRYTASALVEINPRQANVVDFEAVLSGLPADLATIETELEIIQSRKIARRAIQRLELRKNPEFNPALRAKGVIATWLDKIAAWMSPSSESQEGPEVGVDDRAGEPGAGEPQESENGLLTRSLQYLGRILSSREEAAPQGERGEIEIAREEDLLIDAFLAKLSAEPEGRSRVVRISFESTSPETAATAANAVADFYIVFQLEAKFEAAKRATTWLNERVVELRQEVELKEREIEKYRSEFGLLQGGQNVPLTDEQVSALNAQHALELAKLAEARARLRQVNRMQGSGSEIEAAGEVLRSPLIQSLRGEEARLQRVIAELSEQYGDRHPNMIKARAELRDLRAKIQLEVNRVVQGLRNEVAIVSARAASLSTALEETKAEVAKINQSEVKLRALEREASASRTLLENLLQRTKQTTSQESFQQADASVVSLAALPTAPSFPKKKVALGLVFVLSVISAILLAFVLEKLDSGFRSTEQISRSLGVRPLGLLPLISKMKTMGNAPHQYVVDKPNSAYSEAIQSLYTNILLSDVANRAKVLLIGSSGPREGKTSLAIAMVRLLAMGGYKAIVVDCDMHQPRVNKAMNLERGPGLTDCLAKGLKVEDVIQEDPLSAAHVLQAGMEARLSPEQLDSQAMQMLLKQLKRKYDAVILDTAPILAVSDTLFLARLADKTVFLVRWSKTKRAVATLALERIVEAKADVAGVVLSMVDVRTHAQYGYGDSGLYHGALKKYYTS